MPVRLLFASAALWISFLIASPAMAVADSTESLTSAKTQYDVGETFTVDVIVSPNSSEVIVARAHITYPEELMEFIGFVRGPLLDNRAPDTNVSNGRAFLGAFNVYEGVTEEGVLYTLTFRAKRAGTATLEFISGTHLITPDQQNVFAGASPLTLTFGGDEPTEQALPAESTLDPLIVTSETHPDESAWYQNMDAEVCWEPGDDDIGYALTVSQEPNVDPGSILDTSDTCFSFADIKTFDITDGQWFFTIKAQTPDGFTPVSSYRIQIDTTPPNEFPVFFETISDLEGNTNYYLVFAAIDEVSGIDHYELVDADGNLIENIDNPFEITPETASLGTYTIVAVDRAGNQRQRTIDLRDENIQRQFEAVGYVPPQILPPPVIAIDVEPIEINLGPFMAQEAILFRGTAPENALVTLFINSERQIVVQTRSDENGDWEYRLTQPLEKGDHTIYGIAERDGLTSAPSNVVPFTLGEDFSGTVETRITSTGALPWLLALILSIIFFIILIFLKRCKDDECTCEHNNTTCEKHHPKPRKKTPKRTTTPAGKRKPTSRKKQTRKKKK